MRASSTEFVFRILENIRFENVLRIRREGEQHLAQQTRVIFDFSAMKEHDSSALALLVAWKRFANQHKTEVDFIHVSSSLKALAKVCNVQAILTLF